MTAAETSPARFDMGRVVSRTFSVIGRNLVVFGLLALALMAVPYVLFLYGQVQLTSLMAPANQDFSGGALSALAVSIGGLALLVGSMTLQASLVHGVVADLNGRKASFGECLGTGLRFFFPVLGLSILMGIAIGFGLILLLVPGILMMLAWMVAVPALVVEKTGVFGAFSRSASLTRNHRGALFGLTLAYLVVSWIISATLVSLGLSFSPGSLTGLAGDAGLASLPTLLVSVVGQVIQSLVSSAGVASIYYELRTVKEGVGPEALASVFD